ncbi:hypothetical protein [Lysobacter gummosus]
MSDTKKKAPRPAATPAKPNRRRASAVRVRASRPKRRRLPTTR